jgi:putative selenate reductase molybdopterin-binding subunit
MRLALNVNNESLELETSPNARLLDVLRGAGYFGVKHGCDDGSYRTPQAISSIVV